MIDFSKLQTPEEKLIVLFLSVSPPMRQKEIYTILNLNRSKCVKALQRIKIIEKFSEHGVVLYRLLKDTSVYPTNAPTGEKQPTTLTLVNLTEPNLTNGDFNLENSVSGQQTAEGRQQQSENHRLKTDNHEVKPRQKRSHFASAAIPRQPVEKT